jgi:hypothetical protein
MSRRRHTTNNDSLELLLDTICNMFGGMILMAILVVVQTQSSAGRMPDPSSEELDKVIEQRRLQNQATTLQDELLRIEMRKQQLKKTSEAIDSQGLDKLNRTREEFKKAVNEAQERLQDIKNRRQVVDENVAELTQDIAKTNKAVLEKTKRLQLLKEKARGSYEKLAKKVRLPRQSGPASGEAVYFLVKERRVYPFNAFDGGHCHIRRLIKGVMKVRPNPNKGYGVSETDEGAKPFLDILRTKNNRQQYIVLFVYDDSISFESFQILKNQTLSKGFRHVCQWGPTTNGEMTLYPTDHHKAE